MHRNSLSPHNGLQRLHLSCRAHSAQPLSQSTQPCWPPCRQWDAPGVLRLDSHSSSLEGKLDPDTCLANFFPSFKDSVLTSAQRALLTVHSTTCWSRAPGVPTCSIVSISPSPDILQAFLLGFSVYYRPPSPFVPWYIPSAWADPGTYKHWMRTFWKCWVSLEISRKIPDKK